MFKKFFLLIVLSFSLMVLSACDKTPEERTYKADGVYTAFTTQIHRDGPQYTFVSVTVEDDKIVSYFIDCLQNNAVRNAENAITGYRFNEKTKKDLGYLYGMHNPRVAGVLTYDLTTEQGLNDYKAFLNSEGKLEWFEQAELIEAHFLANGPELQVDSNNYIENITGVTILDGSYSALAAEAVQNAKDGVTYVLAAKSTGTNLVWVKAEVDSDGKFTSLQLDTLQGRTTEGKFTWNAKTKQELQYLYGMHNPRVAGVLTYDLTTEQGLNDYKAFLNTEGKLEWFEQVDMITDYVLANGLGNVKIGQDDKLENPVQALTGVTIYVDSYLAVLTELYANFA